MKSLGSQPDHVGCQANSNELLRMFGNIKLRAYYKNLEKEIGFPPDFSLNLRITN
jgi:hypothetical protein